MTNGITLTLFLKKKQQVCNDFNKGSEMIIFELLLTTIKTTIIFEAVGAVEKIGSSLKPNNSR
jgi:hypothetical protein